MENTQMDAVVQPKDYWTYPEGYERVKALIDFLPEEEKDGYLQGLIMAFMDV